MNIKDQEKKVVILAANGQIGVELCMYLEDFENISLTAIVRTEYAATLLRKLDVKYLSGDISQCEDIQRVISHADLVFDLASPSRGFINEIKSFYKYRLTQVFQYMNNGSTFVFASTQAAFGYKEPWYPKLKYYFFPRSVYAANKRYAENLCQKLGKKFGVNVFILRLGDVYGVMQSTTAVIKDLIHKGYVFTVNNVPANTIFIYEIAESLVNITKKKESPGLYTMVSTHPWSWSQLLEYIASGEKQNVTINLVDYPKVGFRHYYAVFENTIINFLVMRRDALMANLPILSGYMPIMKNNILSKRAESESLKNKLNPEYTYLNRFIGVLPGKRMESLSDVKPRIQDHERIIKIKLKNLL